ncbi:hypothetical protein V1517DRAFT_327674 [Lipomyces orientalis]|uniref:Uncharacterized protein n=1 Tax=Lipomyces orientalis TaxID=1233043 RepID=A0ACC3TIS7_9ASCO
MRLTSARSWLPVELKLRLARRCTHKSDPGDQQYSAACLPCIVPYSACYCFLLIAPKMSSIHCAYRLCITSCAHFVAVPIVLGLTYCQKRKSY